MIGLVLLGTPARGQPVLTLTPGGAARGFTLTTFASGFPHVLTDFSTGDFGPFNAVYRPDGHVLVDDVNNANGSSSVYLFPSHADGQIASTISASYPVGTEVRGMAQIQVGTDYNYYMALSGPGQVAQIGPDGAFMRNVFSLPGANQVSAFPGLSLAPPGPYTGHLFVDSPFSGGQIWDINPSTGAGHLFAQLGASGTVDIDGMTFSPDGSILYVASRSGGSGVPANTIRAFNVGNPAMFTDIPGAPASLLDGISIGLGTLNGYLYANYNDGTLWEIGLPGGPHAGALTEIASGGSRGDFVAMDPAVYSGGTFGFPSLLVTQTDRVMRLDPPGGGFFVSNVDSLSIVPEPNSALLLVLGLGSVMILAPRRAAGVIPFFTRRRIAPGESRR
jgi:hypothetical protein